MTVPDDAQVLVSALDGPIPHGRELQERLRYFTVPILRFHGAAPYPDFVGSGVLLKIADLRFILTAGHCVKGDFALTVLGVRDQPHRFELKPASQNFVYSATRGDFGYFQVSSEQAAAIEAGNRIFLNEKSVEVLSAEEHAVLGDFYALGGYPKDMYNRKNEATGSSFLVYSTTMAGGAHAPASTLARGDDRRREFHVWIPQQGNVNTLTTEHAPATLCDFHGASGGGWWATHMNRPEWHATNVKLIGTHGGSSQDLTASDDGLLHKFSRVSLIGNHLALIARDFPTLREYLYATWPSVESYGIEL
ncbi:hypothetical protein SB397_07900 [Burkholderia multivorans]|uniref:hypothetical protein n=1 Tax=Burkholderia multivorans TaxID=87883 RepID=UPI0011B20715|nr:hypothetical protein [Burkholderia multivorans]MEB2485492.1 hypothetical protein [Burkholderia multivorans]MEB2568428.1 hypothetical protein [Burkholderia multivorans]